MERAEIAGIVESIFKRAGFNISALCCSRPSCFDYALSNGTKTLFVKSYVNICGISQSEAHELKKISEQFSATPLFVGEKVREKRMEDDTVYSRYDVYTVNPKTLEDIILKELHPLVEAVPGGYYVRLDGENIRKRRQEMGLSIGKLADMVGISRRTLYGYEKGLAKTSVSTAYQLEWILGTPIVKPINIFEKKNVEKKGFLASARNVITKNPMLKALIRKFSQCNVKILHVEKAPFDFIVKHPERNLILLGGIALGHEKALRKRMKEIISVSQVVEAQPVLITNNRSFIEENGDIPLLHEREILKAKDLEEVIAKI